MGKLFGYFGSWSVFCFTNTNSNQIEYNTEVLAARYTKIHATVENYKSAAEYAHLDFENHGLLNALDFNRLLQRSKVFLGLGFPLEGPAPLEAVANGAIFIQPKFDPPKSRITYKFFSEKPTMRKVSSSQ